MINFNSIKTTISEIVNEISKALSQSTSLMPVLGLIRQFKTSITSDYDSLMNLPQPNKSKIMGLYNDLNELEYSVYRYNELLKADLIKEAQVEANVISQLSEKLITNFNSNIVNKTAISSKTNTTLNANSNIQEVLDFLQKHIKKVGTEQAVKDFQRGLNILNKYNKKSPIEAKRPVEEDGILGNQTYACLENVCQKYTPQIVQKYVRRGAVNNAIFDTKNDGRIDTDKKVLNIYKNLAKEKTNVR
ncbi:MAG: hypothetical protein WCY19_05825 [Candidatus Gastranaerophilaceae bacterium]